MISMATLSGCHGDQSISHPSLQWTSVTVWRFVNSQPPTGELLSQTPQTFPIRWLDFGPDKTMRSESVPLLKKAPQNHHSRSTCTESLVSIFVLWQCCEMVVAHWLGCFLMHRTLVCSWIRIQCMKTINLSHPCPDVTAKLLDSCVAWGKLWSDELSASYENLALNSMTSVNA